MRVPDVKDLLDFLECVLDRDITHFYAIDSREKNARPKGFIGETLADLMAWAEKLNEHSNIYYAYNQPPPDMSKKAKGEDIQFIMGHHVDLDFKDFKGERAELEPRLIAAVQGLVTTPAGRPDIIASGNGIQALWRYATPMLNTPANRSLVEEINKRIERALGAPPCAWNVDRILRPPGLWNRPTAKKLEYGYTDQPSRLIQIGEAGFHLEDFAALPPLLTLVPDTGRAVGTGNTVTRIDPRAVSYTSDWVVLPYAELVAKYWPDIESRYRDKTDHSEAIYGFLFECVKALAISTGWAAPDLYADPDARRNLAELVFDSGLPFLAHFESNPAGKIAYDIEKVLRKACTENIRATPQLERQSQESAERAVRLATPIEQLTPEQHREAFAEWAARQITPFNLPNRKVNKDGVPYAVQILSERNVRAALAKFKVVAHWDVMRDRPLYECVDPVGGEHFTRALAHIHQDMRHRAQESLLCDCFCALGINARKEITPLMQELAREKRFHPIEDYATTRPWVPGSPSVIDAVADCITSEHSLRRRFLRLFFMSAIGAVCSLDNYLAVGSGLQISGVMVLVGKQNLGKSRFLQAITPPGFHAKGSSLRMGSHGETDAKRECLSGLICVLNEIGRTMRQSEADALKDFLSQDYDEYRPSYSPVTISKPRMTVFAGTANMDYQLTDQTGSRRYHSMVVTGLDLEALAKLDLQQAYAEAWYRVMVLGENWWLTHDEVGVVETANREHEAEAPMVSAVLDYLNNVTDQHQRHWLSMTEIEKLIGFPIARSGNRGVKEAMKAFGCEFKEQLYEGGVRVARKVWHFPVLPDKLQLLRAY